MARQLDNWLQEYLVLTQNSEPPTLYHLWSGISAIASALRRKCYTNWGLRGKVYPNMYVCLVGPPGGRKGTAMKIAKNMVQSLEMPMGSDALGSSQILYKEIRDSEDSWIDFKGVNHHHKSLSVWSEEFQVFLSDKDPMLLASLTDLFDCASSWKYSTLKRGTEDLSNCWLNIIGAITPSLLQDRLSQDAVGGGLVSRIIFVVGYGAIQKVAFSFLTEEEKKIQEKLVNDLQEIALLSGPFKIEKDFMSVYAKWYESGNEAKIISNEKFLGYNARRALHLNKLCMIVSAADNSAMSINAKHFHLALDILQETEREMSNAFVGLGKGRHASVYNDIIHFMQEAGTANFNDLCKRFAADTTTMELEQILDIAERAGKIKEKRTMSGKPYYEAVIETFSSFDRSNLLNNLYNKMAPKHKKRLQ